MEKVDFRELLEKDKRILWEMWIYHSRLYGAYKGLSTIAKRRGRKEQAEYWKKLAEVVNTFRKEKLERLIDMTKRMRELKYDVPNLVDKEIELIEETKKYISKHLPERETWLKRLETFLKKIKEKLKLLPIYRLSMVWMFYATEVKRYTPVPYLELRVWTLTRNPKKYVWNDFNKKLTTLTRILGTWGKDGKFYSLQYSWKAGHIYLGNEEGEEIRAEIIGIERELIDEDEARNNLKTTGLPKTKYNELYRYACFFRKEKELKIPEKVLRLGTWLKMDNIIERIGEYVFKKRYYIHREYNEADIRRIILDFVRKVKETLEGGGYVEPYLMNIYNILLREEEWLGEVLE